MEEKTYIYVFVYIEGRERDTHTQRLFTYFATIVPFVVQFTIQQLLTNRGGGTDFPQFLFVISTNWNSVRFFFFFLQLSWAKSYLFCFWMPLQLLPLLHCECICNVNEIVVISTTIQLYMQPYIRLQLHTIDQDTRVDYPNYSYSFLISLSFYTIILWSFFPMLLLLLIIASSNHTSKCFKLTSHRS